LISVIGFKLKPHYMDLLDICCRLAGYGRLHSKSPASLQRFSPTDFVYNILTCRDVVGESAVLPASRQQIHSMWFRTNKSTASLQLAAVRCRRVCSMLATCCGHAADKSVASPANLQQVASKSPASLQQIRVMWFELYLRRFT
jgi:hypothetical protein